MTRRNRPQGRTIMQRNPRSARALSLISVLAATAFGLAVPAAADDSF